MSIMYVVIAAGGEYDGAWESPEIATFDRERAEQYIRGAELTQDLLGQQFKEYSLAVDAFIKTLPARPYEELLPVPKWGTGMSKRNITVEMRAERNAIKLQNVLIEDKNAADYSTREIAVDKFKRDFFMAIGYDEKHDVIQSMFDWDTGWRTGCNFSIEVLEVI